MLSNESPWTRLREGNLRWTEDRSTAAGDRGAARRAQLNESQNPFALVLGCADSRVPAEILFDQGLGDLFVVRTAGHVVDAAALGSVEYAVEILGVSLIVVLGHEGCGAVAAATRVVDDGLVPPGYIRDIAERIAPDVTRARRAGATTQAEIAAQHSLYTVDLLRERSSMVDAALRRGAVTAVPAQYCLSTGLVSEVHAPVLATV
ncbi:carbonic anhydrase [Actinoplanes sp. TRM 88003]|uniref:Carbonic anhydrase n=1 Tax=Paractinoplanes aksuensis TaxID=2939490 RepID=A0ABT1DW45_9ACTN|nr:carbonic anhydrase [Actinoplanes aksuensis]MCO8274995.1 carbonic anhydrase [Actinoplanes aksuensis]